MADGRNEAGIIRLPEPEVRLRSGLEDEVWSESKSLKGRKFQKIRRRRARVRREPLEKFSAAGYSVAAGPVNSRNSFKRTNVGNDVYGMSSVGT